MSATSIRKLLTPQQIQERYNEATTNLAAGLLPLAQIARLSGKPNPRLEQALAALNLGMQLLKEWNPTD